MSWKGRAAQLQWEREHGVDPLAFDGCRSSDGALMFQHAPMLEIDGMKLVQIKAISPRSTTCTERTSKIESFCHCRSVQTPNLNWTTFKAEQRSATFLCMKRL
ncbi:glutathione S-transferase A2 isoform X2 [Oreochromis niloticus]|uniref:glutathione S-transferase A2 isoform X2 n=1 Tax=Oreochromis niloticus TaxID=8128 RepID=UPI000DF4AD96|nr:glutathione S-transferase A2 isoform X2 [Oreochromis niloticus]